MINNHCIRPTKIHFQSSLNASISFLELSSPLPTKELMFNSVNYSQTRRLSLWAEIPVECQCSFHRSRLRSSENTDNYVMTQKSRKRVTALGRLRTSAPRFCCSVSWHVAGSAPLLASPGSSREGTDTLNTSHTQVIHMHAKNWRVLN